MPIFRFEIARKSIAKRKGGLDSLPFLRDGGTAKRTRTRPRELTRVHGVAWDKSSSSASSPFLDVMHANERARGLTDFVSRYVISRTRTVHNSLPDCRGFKTRATRSKRGIEIGIGSALLHFHLHRGRRSRAEIYRMTTTSMCVKRSRAAAAARTAGPIMMAAAVALFFRGRAARQSSPSFSVSPRMNVGYKTEW